MEILSTLFTLTLLISPSFAAPITQDSPDLLLRTTSCTAELASRTIESTTSTTTTPAIRTIESTTPCTTPTLDIRTLPSTTCTDKLATRTLYPTTTCTKSTTEAGALPVTTANSTTPGSNDVTTTSGSTTTNGRTITTTASTTTTTSNPASPSTCPTAASQVCLVTDPDCTSAGGRFYDIQCGIELTGDQIDLNDFFPNTTPASNTFGACQALCDSTRCAGFSFSEAGTTPECNLFSTVSFSFENSDVISGLFVAGSGRATTTESTTTVSETTTTISQTSRISAVTPTTSVNVTPEYTTTTATSTTTTSSEEDACTPEPTLSAGKRGLAYNYTPVTHLFSSTTCPATASDPISKVSWAYNWYSAPFDTSKHGRFPGSIHPAMQFVPMLWSAHPDLLAVWSANVAAAKEQNWMEVLSFNEPDLCVAGSGASCIPIDEAILAYQEHVSPLKEEGFRLGAPAVTNGYGDGLGNDYLSLFLEGCIDCNIDFIPIHWYGGASDYQSFFSHLYDTYTNVGKERYPIWITEFGVTSGTEEEVEEFMTVVIDALDQIEFVEKYAWFMAGKPGSFPGNLVSDDGESLSKFGKIYDTR